MVYGPPLMTERSELYATGWRDCTQAAAMMLVWFGAQGASRFPLGYTAQEREALERADDHPDEAGANLLVDIPVAMKRRYQLTPRVQSGSLRAALVAAGPDTFFALAGHNANWPAGDHFRRWDPGFTGYHAAAARGTGDGQTAWFYDPEAPEGYAGEPISIDHLMQWSLGDGWALVAKAGEYPAGPYGQPTTEVPHVGFQQATVPTGTWLYTWGDFRTDALNIQVSPGRPMFVIKANAVPNGHLILHDSSGRHVYAKATDVTLQDLSTGAVDTTAVVRAATDPLLARIATIKAKVAAVSVDIADD